MFVHILDYNIYFFPAHQEVTDVGHLYYLLDPKDEAPHQHSPAPLPSVRSPSHSTSPPPLPNHNPHSPAHQSTNTAHLKENSHLGARSLSASSGSKTGQVGIIKSSGSMGKPQESR